VPAHDPVGEVDVPGQQLARVLGVAPIRERRVADEVDEQHRDDPPLGDRLGGCGPAGIARGRVDKALGAFTAELRVGRVGGAAARAPQRERRGALLAELAAGLVLGPAAGAGHASRISLAPRAR
jgi:hypothetical protein